MERPAHKRPLLEESPLPLSDSNNISDHQAKRIRLTLPPISSSFPPTNVPTSYSSYKLPFPSSIHENNNFTILAPLSTTNSTNLPISSPMQIFDLPSIDSLCSLPPLNNFIQQTAPSVNPMSVSAILSNDEDTFVRIDTNSNEIVSGNNNIGSRHHTPLDYHTPLNTSPVIKASSSPSLPTPLKLVQPIIEGMSEIENMHRMRRMERENNIVEKLSNENGECDGIEGEIEGENDGGYENEEEESYEMDEPQVVVENDEALNMEGREERHLGHLIYNSKEILPPLEFHENGLLEIWIESKYLTWFNEKVRTHALWGTDVYTDDSDVVAVLIHTGHYTPPPSLSEWTPDYPDHDLCVTIRVLPKLVQYTSTIRDGYKSRSWGNHHGVSYKIERVCKMKRQRKKGAFAKIPRNEKNEHLAKFLVVHMIRPFLSSTMKKILGNVSCYKYNQHMMMDEEELRKQLETNVLYLENDEERTIFKDQVATIFPLEKSNLDEIFRDDLELREMTWNVVGVIVADKTNPQHSLLCISKRVYWRRKTECNEERVV
ncbi:12292_t:CDS:2 [Funneliformis geosporum]|uniref:12292_t:CDS:1 n=1 Tax=Funneliformis geosporum TaxID=1117311 RepID=A0A9W4SG83_9GLOM|nr:12292_t:CDS:2 [Funneliformis geosporum]